MAEVQRALKAIRNEADQAVTIEVIDDSVVITPLVELEPGEELNRIKASLHKKYGNTFRALSK